jgi:hypothetical protein
VTSASLLIGAPQGGFLSRIRLLVMMHRVKISRELSVSVGQSH